MCVPVGPGLGRGRLRLMMPVGTGLRLGGFVLEHDGSLWRRINREVVRVVCSPTGLRRFITTCGARSVPNEGIRVDQDESDLSSLLPSATPRPLHGSQPGPAE